MARRIWQAGATAGAAPGIPRCSMRGPQPVLAAVKNRDDPFLRAVRSVPGVRVLYITRDNREGLYRALARELDRAHPAE